MSICLMRMERWFKMREKIKIFKKIPELDAEIRTIEKPDTNKSEYQGFTIHVGIYECLGEQGDILELDYDLMPTDEELFEDIKNELKETFKELKGRLLTGREENHLEVLEMLQLINDKAEMV